MRNGTMCRFGHLFLFQGKVLLEPKFHQNISKIPPCRLKRARETKGHTSLYRLENDPVSIDIRNYEPLDLPGYYRRSHKLNISIYHNWWYTKTIERK